jgi:hypothetical protein
VLLLLLLLLLLPLLLLLLLLLPLLLLQLPRPRPQCQSCTAVWLAAAGHCLLPVWQYIHPVPHHPPAVQRYRPQTQQYIRLVQVYCQESCHCRGTQCWDTQCSTPAAAAAAAAPLQVRAVLPPVLAAAGVGYQQQG